MAELTSIDLSEFEDFTDRSRPASARIPRVAIQRKGIWSLNRAAFEALGSPKAVIFAFNRSNNDIIAIRGSEEEVRHAAPVRSQGQGGSYLINAKAFTDSVGLTNDDRLTVFDDIQVVDHIVIIDRSKARLVTSPRRKVNE